MIRRCVLILGLLWPGIVFANDWDALDRDGAFVIMRHALAPGTGDPAVFDLDDCATQRNLNAAGRDQARAIGDAFRARGQAFDVVLTSQWCRCRDTARLLDLAPVRAAPPFNSFFGGRGDAAAQGRAALELLRGLEGRPLVVTHQVNITDLTGVFPRSGEVVVVRVAEGGLEVLGRIRP